MGLFLIKMNNAKINNYTPQYFKGKNTYAKSTVTTLEMEDIFKCFWASRF